MKIDSSTTSSVWGIFVRDDESLSKSLDKVKNFITAAQVNGLFGYEYEDRGTLFLNGATFENYIDQLNTFGVTFSSQSMFWWWPPVLNPQLFIPQPRKPRKQRSKGLFSQRFRPLLPSTISSASRAYHQQSKHQDFLPSLDSTFQRKEKVEENKS